MIITAHYDHVGVIDGEIYNGADDNASGVAALLEVAQYLSTQRAAGKITLTRDIVFAAWSGEEIGLIGEESFGGLGLGLRPRFRPRSLRHQAGPRWVASRTPAQGSGG